MNVEQIFNELIINGLLFIICAVYIPPNSDLCVYLNHLSVVESLYYSNPHCQFIICGDYNVPSLSWSSDKIGYKCSNFLTSNTGCAIIEGFSFLNFFQFNNNPNVLGNILDLIYSSLQDTTVEIHNDPLVPLDTFHPALLITCVLPIEIPVSTNILSVVIFYSILRL